MLAAAMIGACALSGHAKAYAEATEAPEAVKKPNFDLDKYIGVRWYGVYLGGKKTGFAAMKLEKLHHNERPAYRTAMEMELNIAVMGANQKLNATESTTFYADGPMAECLSSLGAAGSFHGVVEGDKIRLTSDLGGAKTERLLPAPTNTLFDETAPLRMVINNPKVGDSVKCPTFDATYGRMLNGEATITGVKKVPFNGVATDVFEVLVSVVEIGMKSPMLVTNEGEVLRLEVPVGAMKLIMRLEDENRAKNSTFKSVEVLKASTVKPRGKMPDLTTADSVRFTLTGIEDKECVIENWRQKYTKTDEGYDLTVQRDTAPGQAVAIPVKGDEFSEFLESTHFYQSENPDIIAMAKEIVGDETDSYKASEKICQWVYNNIRKKGTATISNALETLKSREGDCGEHAALFVGLSRAAGLPARVASGLAYVPGFGAFGGHAWCEVYVGKWIAVDPTFGQSLADAAHIRFTLGDSDVDSYRMLTVIGKLKIKVLTGDAPAVN